MCSVGDDNFEEEHLKYMPPKEALVPSPGQKCNKCKDKSPCIVLRGKDRYCKDCFLAAVVHKFKSTLGKHKLIRPNDRVLVLYKLGHPSSALLHFIRSGLDLETHKKLRFEPIGLFVDDLNHLSVDKRMEILLQVNEEFNKYHFARYFVVNRGDSITSPVEDPELLDFDFANKPLREQVNKSAQNDYSNIIQRQFVIKIAKSLHCKFIFTPDLSTDVASQLLTNVTMGRGFQVPLDSGFCDDRNPDVKILRPLRLFDIKELAFYNHFNNLETLTARPHWQDTNKSVHGLIQKFISDLQVNYPATVTTVMKTGDKLAIDSTFRARCELCKSPLDHVKSNLSSDESTRFSHFVSTLCDRGENTVERYDRVVKSFNNADSVCNNYCYSCNKLNK